MTDDALQGMLFGAMPSENEPAEQLPIDEVRLCALNVNSPNTSRAQRIIDWLLTTKANALVLTEMQPSDGARHILACLLAEGFTTFRTPGWHDTNYHTVIATRGLDAASAPQHSRNPRIVAVDITVGQRTLRLAGIYGLTNGMTPESSIRRREFQRTTLDYLTAINSPTLCIAGDLNVVEPDHQPRLIAFEDHDYTFYNDLLGLGLRDAYRELNPAGGDHSWINPRFGSQRLDHTLIGQRAGTIRTCNYDHTPRCDELSDHAALITTIAM